MAFLEAKTGKRTEQNNVQSWNFGVVRKAYSALDFLLKEYAALP